MINADEANKITSNVIDLRNKQNQEQGKALADRLMEKDTGEIYATAKTGNFTLDLYPYFIDKEMEYVEAVVERLKEFGYTTYGKDRHLRVSWSGT